MIKVISYGHIKPKVTVCSNCGAELEYCPRDVKRLDRGHGYTYIICPVCGKPIMVEVRDDE